MVFTFRLFSDGSAPSSKGQRHALIHLLKVGTVESQWSAEYFTVIVRFFKVNLRSKKKRLAQMKEREKCKKKSYHRPQCAKWFSIYSISKSGIWARWTSPFCRFSASFSLKYVVTDAMLQDNEKMKVQYLKSLLADLFETLQAVRTWQWNFATFQISLLWQPESKLLSIIEKTKGLLLKQKWCSKSNLKQYSLIATAGSIKFWRKMGDTLFLLWENDSLLFLNKG